MAVAIEIVFETHSTCVDNELGLAAGWSASELSELGRAQAVELGRRRGSDRLSAVFCSDLVRAAQTAAIAFAGSPVPVLPDWRLRECDYGQRTGMSTEEARVIRRDHLDRPYPGGESWRQAVARVGRFLGDLPPRWNGQRILVIGHIATRWGLEHAVKQIPLEELAEEEFTWRAGWEFRLT
jgi:2,3-bisphosphoglycerate-dependent phosphoglycerate mutase